MSEHMSINGEINYHHLPCDYEYGFTYCKRCKTIDRATIEFHQGIVDDWMVLRCPKCKKAIWTSKLKRKRVEDDKKCYICKKPTNWIDCVISVWQKGKRERYICSSKCNKKYEKQEDETTRTDKKLKKDL